MQRSVLIVEDEPELAQAMAWALSRQGFDADCVHTGKGALERLARTPAPDLMLLDLMLPDLPGEEVARTVRADPANAGLPIIMVSAKDGELDRVVGLAIGADDYVSKPFSMRELVLRVSAILRRSGPKQPARPARVGALRLDEDLRTAWVGQVPLDLTALELRLLAMLMAHSGRVLSREQLLDEVWGAEEGDITLRAVDARIKALRRKLGPQAERLQTVRGVGYRLGHPG